MIDFLNYDFVHIGVSGGKDSQAALLWLVRESGCPAEKIRATFCDTGNEHDFTYRHVDYMSREIFPIEWLSPPLSFYDLVISKGRFPARRARFCTQLLKIFPSQAYIASLSGRVLMVSGVRGGESKARAEMGVISWNDYCACDEIRPLFDFSLDDIWAFLAKHNSPRNPLYDLGVSRVGCFPCFMSIKSEIRLIAEASPERIDKIRSVEKSLVGGGTFFHRNVVPERFRTVPFVSESGEEMMVASIDDVVDWSRTARYRPDSYELFPVSSCGSRAFSCE